MKIRIRHVGSIAIAVALIAGCATRPVPTDRLNRVAIITSGNTNLFSLIKFGPVISVVDVDGKPVDRRYGPIELEPGTHSVTMQCGDETKAIKVTVAAGEVYRFAHVTTPGVKGCSGSLSRVSSTASPPAMKEAEKPAQVQRAQDELAKKEQLAREERARAAAARAEQLARTERAKAELARKERAAAGPVLTPDHRDVSAAIANWADAWSRKDVKGYLAAYAANFAVPGGRSRRQWEAQRRARIVGKSRIEVKVEALEISVDGNIAKARFQQHYRSNRLTETSTKTLTLVKTNQKWLIQQEQEQH